MTLENRIHRRRVGVVTIIDHGNCGNRLQNYAMQRIIDGLGFACTTIVNDPKPHDEAGKARTPAAALSARGRIRRLARRLLGKAKPEEHALAKRLRGEKRAKGLAFTRAHIRETDFTLYRDTPAGQVDAMYDYFVAGSDQVWNPNLRKLSEIDFLTFASRRKRIAFSASMGVSELPEEARDFYRARLSDFEHISVREQAAAEVVRALTGREVPVTIDPTLMLGREDWAALARRHPQQPAGRYLLSYFLGPRSEACQALIDRLGMRVVHLNDPAEERFYAADPAEFLGLVRDASLVCTDSFHGVIFSVIFGSPFLSFRRGYRSASMGSRIETLLAMLRLEHRAFRDGIGEAELDWLLAPDFGHVRPILETKTAEARRYLAGAFGQAGPEAGARRVPLSAEA